MSHREAFISSKLQYLVFRQLGFSYMIKCQEFSSPQLSLGLPDLNCFPAWLTLLQNQEDRTQVRCCESHWLSHIRWQRHLAWFAGDVGLLSHRAWAGLLDAGSYALSCTGSIFCPIIKSKKNKQLESISSYYICCSTACIFICVPIKDIKLVSFLRHNLNVN